MKTVILGGVGAACLFGGFVWSQAQPSPDRPPGVSAEQWIPITDSVGIAITSMGDATLSFDRPAPGLSRVRANGLVMARHNGVWVVFDELGNTSARVQPAL